MASSNNDFSPQRIAIPLLPLRRSRSLDSDLRRRDTARISTLLWLPSGLPGTAAVDEAGPCPAGDGIDLTSVCQGGSNSRVEPSGGGDGRGRECQSEGSGGGEEGDGRVLD